MQNLLENLKLNKTPFAITRVLPNDMPLADNVSNVFELDSIYIDNDKWHVGDVTPSFLHIYCKTFAGRNHRVIPYKTIVDLSWSTNE